MSDRNNRNTNISERTQWDDIFPPLEYHRPGVESRQMVNSPRADASVEPLDNYASRLRRSSKNAKSTQQAAPSPPASQGSKTSNNTPYRRGQGWPRKYVPAFHRPWHSQHPSVIDNERLIETLHVQQDIFPNGGEAFEPKNTPWFTHWLIAFSVRQTTLTAEEICILYKYKHQDVVPDAIRMEESHVHALDTMLCQGEHEYAYEWERDEGCEDATRDLLNVWLSDACNPWGEESEEEKQQRERRKLLDAAPEYGGP